VNYSPGRGSTMIARRSEDTLIFCPRVVIAMGIVGRTAGVRHISRPFSFALNDFNFDRPERTVIGRVFDRTVSRAAIYSAQRAFPSRPSPAIPSPPPTFRHRLRNNHVVVPRRYLSSPPRMIIITRHEINVTCCVRPVTTFFRPNPANGPKAIVSAFYVARYGLVNYLP